MRNKQNPVWTKQASSPNKGPGWAGKRARFFSFGGNFTIHLFYIKS